MKFRLSRIFYWRILGAALREQGISPGRGKITPRRHMPVTCARPKTCRLGHSCGFALSLLARLVAARLPVSELQTKRPDLPWRSLGPSLTKRSHPTPVDPTSQLSRGIHRSHLAQNQPSCRTSTSVHILLLCAPRTLFRVSSFFFLYIRSFALRLARFLTWSQTAVDVSVEGAFFACRSAATAVQGRLLRSRSCLSLTPKARTRSVSLVCCWALKARFAAVYV
jgi:hypothetical protein